MKFVQILVCFFVLFFLPGIIIREIISVKMWSIKILGKNRKHLLFIAFSASRVKISGGDFWRRKLMIGNCLNLSISFWFPVFPPTKYAWKSYSIKSLLLLPRESSNSLRSAKQYTATFVFSAFEDSVLGYKDSSSWANKGNTN